MTNQEGILLRRDYQKVIKVNGEKRHDQNPMA